MAGLELGPLARSQPYASSHPLGTLVREGRMWVVGSLNEIAVELLKAVERNRIACEEMLAVESGPRYTQLLFNRDVTFGEVVSNTYLSGSDLLTTAQEDRLLGLGWMAPNSRCHSSCERSHPNFHRTWPQGVPNERIVRDLMVAVAFVVVRGEGEPLKLVRGPRRRLPSAGLPCNH
jgi:hypothetical protein